MLELEDGKFKASMKEVQSSMKQAGESMKEATSHTKGIGGTLKDIGSKAGSAIGTVGKLAGAFGLFKATSAIMGMVKDSIGAAFDRQDTMDQFDKTMKIMGVSTKDTEKALESLKGVTKGTAYGLDVAAKATQNFVTRGMGIGDAAKSVGIWSDAVAVYGKGTNEQLESVTTAIGKMRTKGTVEMDNLNTLFDAGIDAVGMYAQAHGQSASDVQAALSSGKISTEDFLTTVEQGMATGEGGIRKIAGSAKDMGGSWSGSFANMKAATTRGMLEIIKSIDEGLAKINLPSMKEMLSGFGQFMETTMASIGTFISDAFVLIGDIITQFQPQIQAVGEWFVSAFNAIKEFAVPIFETVIENIKFVIETLVEFYTNIFSGEKGLGTIFMSMFKSIMDIAVPILQDAISFIQEIVAKLAEFWKENGQLISDAFKVAFEIIAAIVDTIMPQIKATIENVWGLIKAIFSGTLDVILGLIKVFAGIMTGDWKAVWEGVKQITQGVWTAIKGLMETSWNSIKSTATNVWNGIKSAITSPISAAWNTVKGIVDKIKSMFNFKLKFPSISIPHIPLPHFKLSGSFNPLKGQIPSIGVDWYATGGIFSGPSVIGVGESGDEAVLPLSNKGRMKPFAKAVSSYMDTPSNVDSGRGIAEKVTVEVPVYLNGRQIALAAVDDLQKITDRRQTTDLRRRGDL